MKNYESTHSLLVVIDLSTWSAKKFVILELVVFVSVLSEIVVGVVVTAALIGVRGGWRGSQYSCYYHQSACVIQDVCKVDKQWRRRSRSIATINNDGRDDIDDEARL